MIGIIVVILFLTAAGKIWGGWGVVLGICSLILWADMASKD